MTADAPSRPARVRRAIALLLILALATALRLYGIADDSLWGDESLSVFIARKPFADIFPNVVWLEQIPPLHHLLLYFWMKVFPHGEMSLRMPSALAGVATVHVMYLLVQHLFGRREAIAAALVMAVAPLHVEYGQETRTYALAFFLATLSTYLFVRLAQQPKGKLEAFYAISAALLLYSHIYGVFVLAAHQIAYFWWLLRAPAETKPRVPLGRWMIVSIAIALLYSPWVPIVYRWVRSVQVNFWVKEVTWHDISRSYWVYSGSVPLYLMAIALTVTGVARIRRRHPQALALLLPMMLLPVVVPVAVSVFGKPSYAPRYGMVACVGFFPLIGAGIAALRFGVVRWATMLAIVALAIAARNGEATNVPKSPWREALAWLEPQLKPGDRVVIHIRAMTRLYDYYVDFDPRHRTGSDTASLPIAPDLKPGQRLWFILYGEWARPRDILRRGPWYIKQHRFFDDIIIMELDDDIPPGADPWAAQATAAGETTAPPTTQSATQPSAATLPTTSSP